MSARCGTSGAAGQTKQRVCVVLAGNMHLLCEAAADDGLQRCAARCAPQMRVQQVLQRTSSSAALAHKRKGLITQRRKLAADSESPEGMTTTALPETGRWPVSKRACLL